MASKTFYIIESENPEEVLEKLISEFNIAVDSSKLIHSFQKKKVLRSGRSSFGEVIDNNRVLIQNNDLAKIPHPRKSPENFSILNELASRLLYVTWSDTGDSISAELYDITENGLEKIDEEDTNLYPNKKSEEDPVSEDRKSPYQGYSYLPAYFYHKHGFKMFDKYKHQEIDYENLYNPDDDPDEKYICPVCNNEDVIRNGWSAVCENCGYSAVPPVFKGHEGMKVPETIDLSKDNSNKFVAELNESDLVFTSDETSLLDFLNQVGSCRDSRISDDTKNKINYTDKACKRPILYRLQQSNIKINGEEVKPPYNFKLSGSENTYPKYDIKLPNSEDKVQKLKIYGLKSLKTLFALLGFLIFLSYLGRLMQLN